MSDLERQQVLKMVEDGKITAEEGLKLMQALGENAFGEDDLAEALDVVETETDGEAERGTKSDPDFDRAIGRFRRLWLVPLAAGSLLTIASAWWMYVSLQNSGLGFWFYCAWLPFLLGVSAIAIAFESRTSRWLYVNVQQKPGESPQRILILFPLSPVSWLLGLFGNFIPGVQKSTVDEVIQAVFKSTKSSEPLLVDVHDKDGQHVQVYIG